MNHSIQLSFEQLQAAPISAPIQPEPLPSRCNLVFTSPLFYTALLSASFITCSVTSILFLNPIPLALAIISSISLWILLDYKAIHLWGEIKYLRNVYYNWKNPKQYPWFHAIIEDKLYLGAMPLATHNHANLLKGEKIDSIIALSENWERSHKSWVSIPHSPSYLQKAGFNYVYFQTFDYLAPPVKALRRLSTYIYQEIQQSRRVYVHCKSGKGRSATLIAAFLLKYPKMINRTSLTVQEAMNYVHNKRKEASFNKAQINILNAFYKNIHPPSTL